VTDKERELQTLERRDYRVEAILANARAKAKTQLEDQNKTVLPEAENSSTCGDDEPHEETSGVMTSTDAVTCLESNVRPSTRRTSSVMLLNRVFFRPVFNFLFHGIRLLRRIFH
jgi:hypothetical protein